MKMKLNIATNISQAAQGTSEISQNIQSVASVSRSIVDDISILSKSSEDVYNDSVNLKAMQKNRLKWAAA